MIIISLILITTIWVLGLTIVTQEGMLLFSIREWANKKHEAGNKWMEPVIICYYCMPSIHSLIAYLFAIGIGIITSFEWKLVFMYPLVVMGSSLLNGIVWGIHKMIETKTGYFENMEQLTHWDIMDRKKQHQQIINNKK
jgi:hypothetical protein